MVICNRCGRPAGDHRQDAVKKLCRGAVPSNPAKLHANQQKALSTIVRKHSPSRRSNPARPHNPRTIH